jgi:hypothetical protein
MDAMDNNVLQHASFISGLQIHQLFNINIFIQYPHDTLNLPPQIIIVHGRQIIVNQTHGVDHFQPHSYRHADPTNISHAAKHKTGRIRFTTAMSEVLHGFANSVGFGFASKTTDGQSHFNS